MKINTRPARVHTHEGAVTSRLTPAQELERSVLACMLWEDSFYESGESIADRILGLVPKVPARRVGDLAVKARGEYRLRHVPLLLAAAMAKNGYPNTADTLAEVIQRADELTEFPQVYRKVNGKLKPLPAQVKKGLARAFPKFDAYQLAKYDRKGEIKLRDVLRMVHPVPKDEVQANIWKNLIAGDLKSPDTWEVALSGGADKKATFTRLIAERKLGYMALLRNLRNMSEAGVDGDIVTRAILQGAEGSKALPFRFIAAVRAAPRFAQALDVAMQKSMNAMEGLDGRTVIAVDCSGSMQAAVAEKSNLTRQDAAAAIAILMRGICPDSRIIGFGTDAKEIPAYSGLAIADHLQGFGAKVGHGTNIGLAVKLANKLGYDRMVVISDMQSHDSVGAPVKDATGYMVNVAAYQYGIGYGRWTEISGFSEGTVRYIQEIEKSA